MTDEEVAAQANAPRVPGGKDVTWMPTCDAVIERMLDMTGVGPGDHLIDLGAGDGRMVIAAARRGARAMGVEYDADKVALAVANAAAAGVMDRAGFVQADLFAFDFSHATVLTLFLLPALNLRLRPTILAMAPGTRVATNTFDFGSWEADAKFEVPPPECTAHCWALAWVVPAQVAGVWRSAEAELRLEQRFQLLSGTLNVGGTSWPVEGRMRGNRGKRRLAIEARGDTHSARVDGGVLTFELPMGNRSFSRGLTSSRRAAAAWVTDQGLVSFTECHRERSVAIQGPNRAGLPAPGSPRLRLAMTEFLGCQFSTSAVRLQRKSRVSTLMPFESRSGA